MAAAIAVVAIVAGTLVALRGNDDDTASDDASDSSADDSNDDTDDGDTSDSDTSDSEDSSGTDDAGQSTDPGAALSVDDDITIGQLDNGLTYYVLHNERPGQRVQLRLAVNAGSALEDDDQRGAAHFLEHMLFNGTEAYPENELISVLESFGSQFGADVNAYTSYDETVYQLGLTDNDPDLVATAVDVLAQWADHATLDPAQVEAERGVVIEEWRLRDLGLDSRIFQIYEDQILTNSPYGEREPIGVIEQLETMDAERLRRYYEQWYRPDLMAVVVVGDIDVDEVTGLIEGAFGDMTNPDGAPERPELGVDPSTVEPVVITTDPEQPNTFAEVMFPGSYHPPTTTAELTAATIDEIVLQAMDSRLAADASRGQAPYRSSFRSGNAFVRGFDAPSYVVDADTAAIADSVRHVLVEIERLRQFGLTPQEIQRGVSATTTLNDQTYDERDTVQDADYADAFVGHFLTGAPIMDETARHEFVAEVLDEVDETDIDDAIARLFGVDHALTVIGTEADAALLPSADTLRGLADDAPAAAAELGPRPEDEEIDELMTAPEPADIVAEEFIVGFTQENGRELTMENGVRVILYPTNISDDAVTLVSSSPGGFSVIPEEWLTEASFLNQMMVESGVGSFDNTTLRQFLADRFVYLQPTITDVAEGFSGGSSTEDLETLLQLAHLYSTQPVVNDRAVDLMLEQYEPVLADLGAYPDYAAQVALTQARYGDDSRQRQTFAPTLREMSTLTQEDAQALAEDRFTDSTGAVFALVGSFDMSEAEDLARRYLGTLPTETSEAAANVRRPFRDAVIEQLVAAGSDDQGRVIIAFSQPVPRSAEVDILNVMLTSLLEARLRDRIREDLGATYSPIVNIQSFAPPGASTETYIEVPGAPDRLDEIRAEVLAVIYDIAVNGPTEEELATVQEQAGDQLALFSDEELASLLVYYADLPGRPFNEIYSRDASARIVPAIRLRIHAAALWHLDRLIVITQVPE